MVHDDPEDTYLHEKIARIVPLPTFKGDLADWHSFWGRFQVMLEILREMLLQPRAIVELLQMLSSILTVDNSLFNKTAEHSQLRYSLSLSGTTFILGYHHVVQTEVSV